MVEEDAMVCKMCRRECKNNKEEEGDAEEDAESVKPREESRMNENRRRKVKKVDLV
jgi:hypothetical protein